MFGLLLILSVAYWYCLPTFTQSFMHYSEIRGYEILFIFMIAELFFRRMRSLVTFYHHDRPGFWLRNFCLWATISYLFMLTWIDPYWAQVSLVRLYRLWGFALSYAAFCIVVKTHSQCRRLLNVFLFIGVGEAAMICLQGIGIVPNLWAGTWAAGYGDLVFAGTLGANRTLPGHMMVLVFCVAVTYLNSRAIIGAFERWLAGAASVMSVVAMFVTGSRTAWVVFAVFCAALIIKGRVKIMASIFSFIFISILLVAVVPGSIRGKVIQRAKGMIGMRVTHRIARVQEDDALAKFQEIDAGRYELWKGSFEALLKDAVERPQVVIFGMGFNNYIRSSGLGQSAHNMYLTLVFELGLVGLFFYLSWLLAMWQHTSILMSRAAQARSQGERVFLPDAVRALLLAMAASLFAGDILYIYLSAFSFFGFFVFIYAIMNHPAFIYPDREIG